MRNERTYVLYLESAYHGADESGYEVEQEWNFTKWSIHANTAEGARRIALKKISEMTLNNPINYILVEYTTSNGLKDEQQIRL